MFRRLRIIKTRDIRLPILDFTKITEISDPGNR